jgi:hypothetical protein
MFIFDAQVLIRSTVSALWGDDDSEEEGELFEEDYEESFIDDDGEAVDGPGSGMDVVPLPLSERDGEEDDNEEVTEISSPAVARQRNRQAPIVISSDEEEEDEYADADAHGDYGRSWDEEEGDFHDARSGSEGRVEHEYWSDDDPYDDDHRYGFYGYL